MARLALIVGVNKYQIPGCDLKGCVPDALRYKSILVDLAGFNSADVEVLLDKDATSTRIKKTAKALATRAVASGDSFHLIFSGHGAQTEEGNARTDCLCPHDFDWSPDRLVSADWMHEFVAGIPTDVRVRVVIDACHSGDVLRDGIPRPGQLLRDPVVTRAMPGSPVFIRHHGRHKRFRDLVNAFPSAAFIAACRSSETAADASFLVGGKIVHQGALSWFLSKQLEAPKGLIRSVRLVLKAAYNDLRKQGYEQHPVLRGPWEEISKGFTTEVPSGT